MLLDEIIADINKDTPPEAQNQPQDEPKKEEYKKSRLAYSEAFWNAYGKPTDKDAGSKS